MEAVNSGLYLKILGVAVALWAVLTLLETGHSLPVRLGLLPGFSYLGFCMAAWLKNPGRATLVLAIAGAGCSLVFFPGPQFGSTGIAATFSVIRSALVLAGFAAMLHFLLLFPRPGAFVAKAGNVRLLYAPAALFWLLLAGQALFASQDGSALNTFTYVLAGLVTAFYLLAGIIVFLRRYIKAPGGERGPGGLRLILWGSLAGFVPAAAGFMPVFSGVPGNEDFFLSLVLPPMAWALAALREENL